MNKFKMKNHLCLGLFWVPEYLEETMNAAFGQIGRGGTMINKVEGSEGIEPPTYFRLNEFSFAFHEIVTTYGIPSYKEVNPTIFNMVTFPFLFGIMYGDIGHGGLLLLASIFLCFKKDQVREMGGAAAEGFIKARYLLLLMGLFATYCGFIYNDMMAIPLNLFGSCYTEQKGANLVQAKDCVYTFGVDPKWYLASNDLSFMNSLKMKTAVILGVMQMLLGIMMKGVNDSYKKDWIGFYFEFIPQVIFLTCLFGYMDFLIIMKWNTDWTGNEHAAPSIISQVISNMLKGGQVVGDPLIGTKVYQQGWSNLLLWLAVLMVPPMLLARPYF
jgi:V-type H+-transporting ATPase subunit a